MQIMDIVVALQKPQEIQLRHITFLQHVLIPGDGKNTLKKPPTQTKPNQPNKQKPPNQTKKPQTLLQKVYLFIFQAIISPVLGNEILTFWF